MHPVCSDPSNKIRTGTLLHANKFRASMGGAGLKRSTVELPMGMSKDGGSYRARTVTSRPLNFKCHHFRLHYPHCHSTGFSTNNYDRGNAEVALCPWENCALP